MVKISDIKDEYSLHAWLEDQPREVSVWIASRAAARVLPVWWDGMLTEDWPHSVALNVMPILRPLFTASVAAFAQDNDIQSRCELASNSAYDAARTSSAESDAPALFSDVADAAAQAAKAASALRYTEGGADASDLNYDAAAAAAHATLYAVKVGRVVRAKRVSIWREIRIDATEASGVQLPDALPLWSEGPGPLAKEWAQIKEQLRKSSDLPEWQFWLDWYDAQLAGRTMLSDPKRTLDMLEEIALIDPETWDAGPEAVNPKIREIWEGYKEGSSSAGHAADPEPVSEDAKSAMKQRVAVNRDALVVASAGIIDQLGAYREQVRGMNHLEPEVREEVLAFIDEFSGKLSRLIHGLPATGTVVDDDQAGRLVLWLREYRGLLQHKLAYYGSAENMAEATVPTGIILGATGIGAMLGMPVAGSVVGGLIVNQMKPGQAARELTKPSSKDTDLP